jgi:hypothetical protein
MSTQAMKYLVLGICWFQNIVFIQRISGRMGQAHVYVSRAYLEQRTCSEQKCYMSLPHPACYKIERNVDFMVVYMQSTYILSKLCEVSSHTTRRYDSEDININVNVFVPLW